MVLPPVHFWGLMQWYLFCPGRIYTVGARELSQSPCYTWGCGPKVSTRIDTEGYHMSFIHFFFNLNKLQEITRKPKQ